MNDSTACRCRETPCPCACHGPGAQDEPTEEEVKRAVAAVKATIADHDARTAVQAYCDPADDEWQPDDCTRDSDRKPEVATIAPLRPALASKDDHLWDNARGFCRRCGARSPNEEPCTPGVQADDDHDRHIAARLALPYEPEPVGGFKRDWLRYGGPRR